MKTPPKLPVEQLVPSKAGVPADKLISVMVKGSPSSMRLFRAHSVAQAARQFRNRGIHPSVKIVTEVY